MPEQQAPAAPTTGRAMAAGLPACVGQVQLLFDTNIEGWCWYPDRPAERALVDILVNGRIVASTKAARMRTDLREFEGCDGYCGFSVALGAAVTAPPGGVVIEARERRLGQVIGRVVRPDGFVAPELEARLRQVEAALDATSAGIGRAAATGFGDIAAPLRQLGDGLLHLSRRPGRPPPMPAGWALAACHEALRAIPAADLFQAEAPRVSLLTPGAPADGPGIDRVLAAAARLLRPLGAEFILVEDGSAPLNRLLPVRLRHLRVVQAALHPTAAAALNEAALLARGTWLAFAWAGRLGLAGLAEACGGAVAGTLYADAAVAPRGLAETAAAVQRHGLVALCEKALFEACGGFDAGLEGTAMWADFLQRAAALQARIIGWNAPRPGFQPRPDPNEVPHARR